MEEKKSMKSKLGDLVTNAKTKVADTGKAALKWVGEHPLEATTLAGVAASLGSKGFKAYKIHTEEKHRERTFYDPRKGRYSTARRNLRNYEIDEIETRYDDGESYHHILMDMGLLK